MLSVADLRLILLLAGLQET